MDSQKTNASSVVQLIIFTLFLFLLVAIPYTIYLKANSVKTVVKIISIPTPIKSPSNIFPTIVPPQGSITTTCFSVPVNFIRQDATPSAYMFASSLMKELCFPPTLPPYPFTWTTLTSSQYNYTIDIPSNWTDKTTTILNTTHHIFVDQASSSSAVISVAFTWYPSDPYATQSSYLAQPIKRNGKSGIVYTLNSFISAVFPLGKGYLLLEASKIDSAFYAFEHMLDSLSFQ